MVCIIWGHQWEPWLGLLRMSGAIVPGLCCKRCSKWRAT